MTTALMFAACASFITFSGGFLSYYFKDQSHYFVSFSAGAVLGLAFFDLMPEALELSGNNKTVFLLTAIGFTIYLIIDRFLHNHENIEHAHSHTLHSHLDESNLRAFALSVHSFMDGLGIGLAFLVSSSVGLVFAIAVLAHDFSDGINTVSALKNNTKRIKFWLLLNSLSPIFGVLFANILIIEDNTLGLLLSVFAGFFLYIGASNLIPETYHSHPHKKTTLMTILGMSFIYIVLMAFTV